MNKFLSSDWVWGYISACAGWCLSFVVPVAPFLSIIVALVVCDLYTGVKAARKRGETIISKGLRRTVEKISLYFVAILLSEAMRIVFIEIVPVTYITAFAIALTEFKSNIENVEKVTGVNIWHYLKSKIPGGNEK